MMEYLWDQAADMPKFPALERNVFTDVLIIGGGMAGLLCARALEEAGVGYILVEAKHIGGGITKGTTAVISAQHDTLYSDMAKSSGAALAKAYLEANLRAVEEFRRLSKTIGCDFEDKPSLMYDRKNRRKMMNEAAFLNSLGFKAAFTKDSPLPFSIAGGVVYPGMAQFHPLKFLAGAAKGLNIYENTFVTRLEGDTAYTQRAEIHAKKIIICSHFPFINSHGLYFMKLYQKRSYVIALENALDLNCTAVDYAENGLYFRNYQNLLIIGGGDHRTGKKGDFERVRAFAAEYFPGKREAYAWANQDCMSLDGVPYIGRYSPSLPNVFVASGFNEWGMTTSMVASMILKDLVTGRENPFAFAFSPHRSMLKPQLAANLGSTLIDFVTPTVKRCSHMGCALKWNPAEHSWDCPCHGSRFDEDGDLIDNPATRRTHV